MSAKQQIDRVRGADQHHHAENPKEPAEVDHDVLQEGNGKAGFHALRAQLDEPDDRQGADHDLGQQLEPAGQAVGAAPGELQHVVGKADRAEADRDVEDRPHEAVGQIRPQQGRHAERQEDEEAAHGRRARLGQHVGFRPVVADRLSRALLGLQPLNDARADDEADDQRRQHGAAAAEGQIAEQVEDDVVVGQGGEQVEQHARPPTRR
jgi:hypothetical protein